MKTEMRRNSRLQHEVLAALENARNIESFRIGVTADGGIVTLTGHVPSYTEKVAAERVARRVKGVYGVANDIQVKPALETDDADIARAALRALRGTIPAPRRDLQVTVSDHWLTLDGCVTEDPEKRLAFDSVRNLRGVIGVSNNIEVMR